MRCFVALAALEAVAGGCGAFYSCTANNTGCAPLWDLSHTVCCTPGAPAASCAGVPVCPAGAPPDWPVLNSGCRRGDPPSPPALPSSVVFSPGLANVTTYRIPSIVQLGSRLIAFAEARRGSSSDAAAREIATRTSTDGGATWGEVTFAIGNHAQGDAACYTGNPAATVAADGSIVLVVALHSPSCGGNCVTGNAVTFSRDGGVSWSAPLEITASLGTEGKSRTGPGLGLQLPSGRLLVPASTGTYTADHVYLSDDGGSHWRVANDSALGAGSGLDEAQITPLPNGSLLIMMRHQAETYEGKASAMSHDGGETWGELGRMPYLEGPNCQSSIVTIGGSVFYSGPDSNSHQRIRMTVRRSDDSAASFPTKLLIDPGDGGYSCLVPGALADADDQVVVVLC